MKMKLSAALMFGLLVTGCSSPEDKMRDQFLSGCAQSGADRALCNCVFDKLMTDFDVDYFERMNRRGMPTSEFLDATMRAGLQCQNM